MKKFKTVRIIIGIIGIISIIVCMRYNIIVDAGRIIGITIGIMGTIVSLWTGLLSLPIQIKIIKREKKVPFSAMILLTMCLSYTLWFTYALVAPKGFDIFILISNSPGAFNIWRIVFLYEEYEKKPLLKESMKELRLLLSELSKKS